MADMERTQEVIASDEESLQINLVQLRQEMLDEIARREAILDGMSYDRLSDALQLKGDIDELQLGVDLLTADIEKEAQEKSVEEREGVRAQAEVLHKEAMTILTEGWDKMRRCHGYAGLLWREWGELKSLWGQLNTKRAAYQELCRSVGIEPHRIVMESDHVGVNQKDDICLFSGANLPMSRHLGGFLRWIEGFARYGLGIMDTLTAPDTRGKDRW